LVTDALFRFRRGDLDDLPKLFERGSLVIAYRFEIIVVSLGFVCLGWCAGFLRLVFFGVIRKEFAAPLCRVNI
jgi:hypothetical protein